MKNAGIDPEEINEIVLVGGSSRIPRISRILDTKFRGRVNINNSMDADVVVA